MLSLLLLITSLALPARADVDPAVMSRLLDLVDDTSRAALKRAEFASPENFDLNVNDYGNINREIGAANARPLWGSLADYRYIFPIKVEKDELPSIVMVRVAKQTRIFSWYVWRVSQLRADLDRDQEWRTKTVGRLIAKLREDLEDEFVNVAQVAHQERPYHTSELKEILGFARDIAPQTQYVLVRDYLAAVGRVQTGRGPHLTHATARRALVKAIEKLTLAVQELDRIACGNHLAN